MTCACGAGDVARAALHFFQVKISSIGTLWNAGHSCQTLIRKKEDDDRKIKLISQFIMESKNSNYIKIIRTLTCDCDIYISTLFMQIKTIHTKSKTKCINVIL